MLTRVEADASSGKTSRHFKDYVGKAPFKLHTVEDLFKSSLIESGMLNDLILNFMFLGFENHRSLLLGS
ncbi:hypothetical protein NE237_000091 [Protea cynaroides]|uniref:Uncharacterized protein n=1 Tax=Protea cynaroides TaxID=273540 RepID=A0A9Q0JS44_9MAGN|nr:hypothetical protein NE237_000091 [Protea cynaroides]